MVEFWGAGEYGMVEHNRAIFWSESVLSSAAASIGSQPSEGGFSQLTNTSYWWSNGMSALMIRRHKAGPSFRFQCFRNSFVGPDQGYLHHGIHKDIAGGPLTIADALQEKYKPGSIWSLRQLTYMLLGIKPTKKMMRYTIWYWCRCFQL